MNKILTSITEANTWYDVLVAATAAIILMIIFVKMLNALKKTHDVKFTFTITEREVKTIEPSSKHIDKHQQE